MGIVAERNWLDHSAQELWPLQLQAAQEYFAERRQQVPILARRADDMRVDAIRNVEDMGKVLFAHTTYKSYPQAYIDKGQWDKLTRWVRTLSTQSLENVDLNGVADIDDWIGRLWAAGHFANTTSGTSGKISVLNRTSGDDENYRRCYAKVTAWPRPIEPDHSRNFFMLGPRRGPYLFMIAARIMSELFGKPGEIHFLTEEPLLIANVTRMAAMRRRMADGSATPQEIADFEAAAKAQAQRGTARFAAMADMILARRREPAYIVGPWVQLVTIMEIARARGIADGEFHPETVISSGGDLKGAKLVSDWYEQLFRFFGNTRRMEGFGMSEMSFSYPRCEVGNYHQAPWIIPVMLDAEGDNALPQGKGVVQGRLGVYDIGQEGRWGGLISGDKVEIHYDGDCPCGRASTYLAPQISRFNSLGEEDKIGCAGTIDSYIRGVLQQ